MAEQSTRAESPEAKRCKHDMEVGAFEPSVAALGIAELAEDSDLLVQQRRREVERDENERLAAEKEKRAPRTPVELRNDEALALQEDAWEAEAALSCDLLVGPPLAMQVMSLHLKAGRVSRATAEDVTKVLCEAVAEAHCVDTSREILAKLKIAARVSGFAYASLGLACRAGGAEWHPAKRAAFEARIVGDMTALHERCTKDAGEFTLCREVERLGQNSREFLMEITLERVAEADISPKILALESMRALGALPRDATFREIIASDSRFASCMPEPPEPPAEDPLGLEIWHAYPVRKKANTFASVADAMPKEVDRPALIELLVTAFVRCRVPNLLCFSDGYLKRGCLECCDVWVLDVVRYGEACEVAPRVPRTRARALAPPNTIVGRNQGDLEGPRRGCRRSGFVARSRRQDDSYDKLQKRVRRI